MYVTETFILFSEFNARRTALSATLRLQNIDKYMGNWLMAHGLAENVPTKVRLCFTPLSVLYPWSISSFLVYTIASVTASNRSPAAIPLHTSPTDSKAVWLDNYLNTERSYKTRLNCSGCQSQIPIRQFYWLRTEINWVTLVWHDLNLPCFLNQK